MRDYPVKRYGYYMPVPFWLLHDELQDPWLMAYEVIAKWADTHNHDSLVKHGVAVVGPRSWELRP